MKRALAAHAPKRSADPAGAQLVRALLDAAHRLEGRLEDALRPANLSLSKYWLLHQLAESDGPLMLSELAAGQGCAPSNITQLIDRLEVEGFVRRVEQPRDRRSKRAELTPLGKKLHADGARQVARVQAEFLGALSPADRKALARGLGAME